MVAYSRLHLPFAPSLLTCVCLIYSCIYIYIYVYIYIYIYSWYVSREQFAFPRVGGKPERSLSGTNHPTMQRLLTETGPLEFQIEQLKKQIADRDERLKNLKEETREIEKNRKNECGEKPVTGQKRHMDEEKAEEEAEEEMFTGCPSCRWEAWLEKEYEKKEMVIFPMPMM